MILADFAQASIPLDNIACLYVGEERQLCQQSLALGIQNYICLLYMTFLLHFMSVEIRLPKLAINAGFVNRSSISKSIIFKPTHWEKLSTRFEREFTSTYANEKQPESPPSSPSSFGEQMLPCRCSIIIHCTISPFWNHSQCRMSGCTEIICLSSLTHCLQTPQLFLKRKKWSDVFNLVNIIFAKTTWRQLFPGIQAHWIQRLYYIVTISSSISGRLLLPWILMSAPAAIAGSGPLAPRPYCNLFHD